MAKKKSKPLPLDPEGFEKYLRMYLRNSLRLASIRWPYKNVAKNLARKERGLYECAMCKNLFKNGEFQMDHIQPAAPVNDPNVSIETWVRGLLSFYTNWQCLCIQCHTIKSGIEGKVRTGTKRANKQLTKDKK